MTTSKPAASVAVLLMLLFFYGCASVADAPAPSLPAKPVESFQFFAEMDAAARQHHTTNAAYARIKGFPQLRVNRFLAALPEKMGDSLDSDAWVRAMRQLDRDARRSEVNNLPDTAVAELNTRWGRPLSKDREHLFQLIKTHGKRLTTHQSSQPEFRKTLTGAAHVPDEYRTWQRIVGIHPLFVISTKSPARRTQKKIETWRNSAPDQLPVDGKMVAFSPAGGDGLADDMMKLLRNAPRDQLGRYRLTPAEQREMAQAFAPVWAQDVAGDYDLPGQVVSAGGNIAVNPKLSATYYYFTHAFADKTPVLQINYVIWYTGRRGPNVPMIERGNLDGLTLRITFGTDGVPLMADGMNNCGAYHFFAPNAGQVEIRSERQTETFPFAPTDLPAAYPQQRLTVRVSSGWHQVQNITEGRFDNTTTALYRLIPYRNLESLPETGDAEKRNSQENLSPMSLFNGAGIAKGSGRVEPFLLFSAGVPDIGSMRQRGHHAIRRVGRGHFTDPDLLNDYFTLKPAESQ